MLSTQISDKSPFTQYLLLIAVLSLNVWIAYTFVLYPFFLSPLRSIPRAHWSTPFPYIGSLWILHQRARSRNNTVTAEAHRLHGPLVRLGHNELSVNCYEGGIKTIYAGGFEKHEWYPRQFANFGVMNMFSTVGHSPHGQKKRIMANIYSKSFIQSSAQIQANSQELLHRRFLPLIKTLADSCQDADIHEINNAFTMDFMTAYQFGISQATNFTQDVEVRKKYLHLYHSRRDWQFISSEVPPFVRKTLQKVGISLYPDFIHRANEWLEDWSRRMCEAADQYLKTLQGADQASVGDEPLVFKQYKSGLLSIRKKDPVAGLEVHPHLDEGMNFTRGLKSLEVKVPDEGQTLLEVYSDMVDQLAAGHETSALALTYLYYELSRHPRIQERLHNELTTLQPRLILPKSSEDLPELPATRDIDALPFLNSVILEILRLHAPIPGMQPRITPDVKDGVSLGPPGSKYQHSGIPPNVRVSAMAYTLHKIPEVFPSPESFVPDRWLLEHTNEAQLTEMNRHFWAFGSGGRMCIGRHLAIQEIKLIVAAVWTNFRTSIVDSEGIEEVDAYTTRPRSGQLIVKFQAR